MKIISFANTSPAFIAKEKVSPEEIGRIITRKDLKRMN
ncbi:hypothetical protein LEP1GSC112_0102 [Leptospira interrogans serovar Pomona str. UT364]|nr:hypothetical protein LEP1GSC112_0102 [Leptospira interrogans serovar Pomona str. UT364]